MSHGMAGRPHAGGGDLLAPPASLMSMAAAERNFGLKKPGGKPGGATNIVVAGGDGAGGDTVPSVDGGVEGGGGTIDI